MGSYKTDNDSGFIEMIKKDKENLFDITVQAQNVITLSHLVGYRRSFQIYLTRGFQPLHKNHNNHQSRRSESEVNNRDSRKPKFAFYSQLKCIHKICKTEIKFGCDR